MFHFYLKILTLLFCNFFSSSVIKILYICIKTVTLLFLEPHKLSISFYRKGKLPLYLAVKLLMSFFPPVIMFFYEGHIFQSVLSY